MGISTVRENGSGREGILTAAALCVVPGLGQIYNGEARKGLLFFCAGAANVLFLLIVCVKGFLLSGAKNLGDSLHVRLNPAVLDCLHNIDVRSPQMLLLCVLLTAFTLFCLRDAVETRQHLRNRQIYANEALAISEAASGSYVFHALVFVSMFLLVLFLFVPPEVKPQFTEITFLPEQPKTTKPVQTKLRSQHDSENGGKAQTKPVIDTPKRSQSSPSQQKSEQSQPKQKQVEQARKTETEGKAETKVEKKSEAKSEATPESQPAPKPPTSEKVAQQPVSTPKPPVPHFAPPRPMEAPAPLPQPTNPKTAISAATPTPTPTLQPTKTSNTSASNALAPLPLLAMALPSRVGFTPAPTASSSSGKAAPSPAPAPASSHRTPSSGEPSQPGIQSVSGPQNADSAPRPSISSGHPSHSSNTGKDNGAPLPRPVATAGSGGGRPIVVAPVVPGSPGGTFDHGGPAVPVAGDPLKPIGTDSNRMPDYAKYMEELQRRIKRSWFPPRAPESKKVIVVFTIHLNGELSNVHVLHSSGDHVSDEAAVRAVEHAAPFMPLPRYSDDTIDVQFTFDYNLFTGHSSGIRY
jgi:TonB family protein